MINKDLINIDKNTIIGRLIYNNKITYEIPKNTFPIGLKVYNKFIDKQKFESYKYPLFLNFKPVKGEARNIFIYGTAGSGKTYTTRGIIDRVKDIGFNVVVLTDVKNEYYTSKYKNKSGTILDKYKEEYKSQDISVYRPLFFGKPFLKHEKLIQFNLSELERIDLIQLVNLENETTSNENKRTMFEIVLKYIEDHKSEVTMDNLINYINSKPEFNNSTKRYLINRLENCRQNNVIGTMYNQKNNLFDDLKNNKTIIINLNNYENYMSYSQIYVSVINRMLAKFQENQSKPIIIVVDEASAFVPRDGVASSKQEIQLNYQRRRYLGIKNITISQEIKDIMETAIKSSQIIMIPSNPDMNELLELVEMFGKYQSYGGRHTMYSRDWWRLLIQSLKKHEWIIYEKNAEQEIKVVKGIAPLSLHEINNSQKKLNEI